MQCVADRAFIKKAFLVLELIIRQRLFRADGTIRDGVSAGFCIAGIGMWVVSQRMIYTLLLLVVDHTISSSGGASSASHRLSDIREIRLRHGICLQRVTPLVEVGRQPRCFELCVSIVHLRRLPSG